MALTPLLHFTFQIKGFQGLPYVILLPFYTVDTIFTVLNISIHNFSTMTFFTVQFDTSTAAFCMHTQVFLPSSLTFSFLYLITQHLTLTFAHTPPHLFLPSLNSPPPTLIGDKSTEIPYMHILNNVLPDDIRVLAWAPVGPDFSARFSCLQRTYKYFFPRGNMDIDVSL